MNERAFRLYVIYSGGVLLLGLIALSTSWFLAPLPMHVAVPLLALAAIAAENAAIVLPRGLVTSLAYPLSLAANIMFGPTAAGVVALCSSVNFDDLRQRISPSVLAFNVGQVLVAHVVSGWLFLLAGGRTLWGDGPSLVPLMPDKISALIVPLALLGLSASAINASLVCVGIALKYAMSLRAVWNKHLRALFPIQLSLSVAAVSIAQVMAVQLAGLVLFVFPLLVSRQVYQRYLALRQSYVDTVRSLVAALEAKDRYTAGHSERVATYAVDIARSMQLPDEVVERIDLAAQVHDLGKVGIPDEVLSKPGRLTAAEFDLIRNHPEDGAEIVARVPGLAHIVPIVRHHHERFDGAGYSRGLAGDDIPIEARIMAVADSFDAMTSSRAYRPAMEFEAAIAEMKSCAGTQFDAEVVEHFVGLLSSTREAGE